MQAENINIIELKNVSYKYLEHSESAALDNLNLEIKPGEWLTIIGPNGSGKSTLTKVINGLLIPDEGEVIIDGITLDRDSVYDARKLMGMVFQNPENQFVGSTVEDDVAFGLENMAIPREEMKIRVKEALERVGMWDLAKRVPAHLSGGQMQRVAIASVLVFRPNILILDEATSMLDPQGRAEVFSLIKKIKEEDNLTVIAITHDIEEAVESDRIIVMENGQIALEDSPREIFKQGDNLLELGLEVPFSEQLKGTLKNLELNLPEQYLDEEELMEYLWTYNSET